MPARGVRTAKDKKEVTEARSVGRSSGIAHCPLISTSHATPRHAGLLDRKPVSAKESRDQRQVPGPPYDALSTLLAGPIR